MPAMLYVRPSDKHRCYALRKANSRRRLLLRAQKTDVSGLNSHTSSLVEYKLWHPTGD